MGATDVTSTKDTQGGMGDAAPYHATTDHKASNKDTTGPMGQSVTDDYEPGLFPDQSGTRDTEGVQGGRHTSHKQDWDVLAGNMTGTLDTLQAGAPTKHADPAYRKPNENVGAIGAKGSRDTTGTDLPISDGTDPDFTVSYMTGTKDTVNPTVALATTSDLIPPDATVAPTVAARPRAVLVTITPLAHPTGAKIKAYRVEGSTGGTDFIPANQTSVLVTTLEPSRPYKFRYAAENDNGVGEFSPWSSAVVPLNPDEPGPGHPVGLTEDNKVNPIYLPSGAIKPGTGGTTGPVASIALAATANPGELKVDWTAPTWGTQTGYKVTLSTGETATKTAGQTTHTFTGLSAVARTATITPTNARGNGIAKTSTAATPAA